jgi:hypothetical protein
MDRISIQKYVFKTGSDLFANCIILNPLNKDPKSPLFMRELFSIPIEDPRQSPLTRHEFCDHAIKGGIYLTIAIPNIVNGD